MLYGAGAYATTHFNPTLQVKILGLTAIEADQLLKIANSDRRDVIGQWLVESDMLGNLITIYRVRTYLFIEEKFVDGHMRRTKVIEVPSSNGRRFEPAQHSSTDDHWVLTSSGNLEIRDEIGLYNSLVPIP